MRRQATSTIGLWFCAVYATVYFGFVAWNAIAPEGMDWKPLAGLNVAVVYGIGLILLAFILAIVYGVACAFVGDEPTDSSRGPRP